MEKIESFKVNHLDHPVGIYLSRIDGDIFTYDVRMSTPYKDKKLSTSTIHSLEHVLATVLRNGSHKDNVIYAGPMGCQTGFYVLLRNIELDKASEIIISAMRYIAIYDGEMPGGTMEECGNFYNLSLNRARGAAKTFVERVEKAQARNRRS